LLFGVGTMNRHLVTVWVAVFGAVTTACSGDVSELVGLSSDDAELRCDKNPSHPRCRPAVCGDSVCNGSESCSTCASDCGSCTSCGDGACNGGESCSTCASDCGACTSCGDGACNGGESCSTCASDCGACASCGDGACNGGETCSSCASDCGACQTPTSRGPQPTITCPAGAVNISPGQDIPSVVNAYPAGTAFCVLAGTHSPRSPIMLKPNQKLIGQYGAIIDGTNVSMTYDTTSTSIIRSWNCGAEDCSGGVVQNLVLRNLKTHQCIGILGPTSNNWTIDHNEVYGCKNGISVSMTSGTRITNNYVHHNVGDASAAAPADRGGGYGSYKGSNNLWENNEIAFNGPEQKMCGTTAVTFRGNYVHHNENDGIWYDGDNTQMLVEGNVVEDHAREGIFIEISAGGILRDNIVRRSGSSGIFVSTSRDLEIYRNTLEDNFRAIQYFLNCSAVGVLYEGSIGFDLSNNDSHDNIIKVGPTSGSIATDLALLGSCTSTQAAPYVNGQKNLVYRNNRYYTPTTSGAWWLWGNTGLKTWSQWQALGQDTGSTLALSSSYSGAPPPTSGGTDTTAPAVSISNPPESAVVSGTIAVVINASDNVGVVGVQLKVDGVNVGAEKLSAPFSISWNTTGWSNGNHVLQAVARDAAGNLATSTANTVTVSN
jgi:parallel beta-helix repeat protein